MSEEDPRLAPAPPAEVPRLLREGARLYNEGRFWHAHEAWEEAWHALRAVARPEDADFLQGMILATAAFENCRRGKERGFKRQMAEALHRLRTRAGAGERLGLADEGGWVDALVGVYLDACRTVRFEDWRSRGLQAPPLRLDS